MIDSMYRRFTWFLNLGVKKDDSASKARAIRISNIIWLSATANCLIFVPIFYNVGDITPMWACIWAALFYAPAIVFNYFGKPNIGRPYHLIAGDLAIFWFACYFRGDSLLQLFYFSLSVLPFMYFAWEERRYYILTLLPSLLLIGGEWANWDFFTPTQINYNMRTVRTLSYLTPLSQIMIGFYYFLKQSVHFENESIKNLKKLELEYKKQIQVHKMSSLGEMAGGMSHEINNPLTIILGTTYKLKKDLNAAGQLNTPTYQGIDRIEATANRIAKIVRALKKFSRNAERDPTERVRMQKLMDDTLDLCHERFNNAHIQVRIKIDPTLELNCRPTEISQVLVNLLNNSYDALSGKDGAWVEIRANQSSDGGVEIIVEDSGTGIDPEVAQHIMEPFFTTKEVGKGTGLGLAISKGIIESHHGNLVLVPDTGHTTFKITLP